MKQRSTTPVSIKRSGIATKSTLIAAAVMMMVAVSVGVSRHVFADEYDDQINAIQNEINQYQASAGELGKKADSLQSELQRLNNEKAIIQGQVDLSQAKYEKLKNQIEETRKKIDSNKDALGVTLADIYVDDKISPLEMLASSNNIGDYVDKQTYRTTVSDKLQKTIDEINALKKQLEQQKKDTERTLSDQKNARDNLAAKEAERQAVLAETKGQEDAYKQLAAKRVGDVNELKRKQQEDVARRLAQSGGGGFTAVPGSSTNGGYPSVWANAPQDSIVDSWGMYNRECTSYAAYRVAQAYGNMPYWGGVGNAYQWIGNAKAAGIPNGKTPRAGSIGVLNDGGFGHVAWVDSVQSDGTITIDHYNINWSGQYARWTGVSPSFFDDYIYFGEW